MTTKKITSCLAIFFCCSIITLSAQDATSQSYSGVQATPEHKWELGIHAGHAFVAGDIDFNPSFGAGIHVRRALDYLFSIRGELLYSKPEGEDNNQRSFSADWLSGSLHGVITLNNMKWDKPSRKANLYFFAGPGLTNHSASFTDKGFTRELDNKLDVSLDAGAGIAFKISPKFNIGIEHKSVLTFGQRADLLDGFNNPNQNVTTYRDLFNYTSIRLNFNLGGDDKAEPLYWLNPLDLVLQDISELKARPVFDLTDTDGDGIIDMIDQEKDSPAGSTVDTRGVTLDSDGDGIADYQDKEPYSPVGYEYDAEGVAQVPAPDFMTRDQTQGMIDAALRDFDVTEDALVDWFLPMIHFDIDSYKVKQSMYGDLAGIAQVIKSNPTLRFMVKGYTDKTASDSYNERLSYNRAQAAVDHLVNNYNIARNRLVLNYGGENETLVPVQGNSYMNRRVEFMVAPAGATDMAAPGGTSTGSNFSGSRDAGY
ncbi:MAG: OmpA family protein [Saprospiraceae bacterium]